MHVNEQPESAGQMIGGLLLGLAIAFCGLEMVPGWRIFNLEWPRSTFYAIMAGAGAVGGLLLAPKYRLPGLLGGLVGGPSSLFAVALLLDHMNWTHKLILMLVALVGAVPGIIVYNVLRSVQNTYFPPADHDLVDPVREGDDSQP
jgi:hypothetical protein